MVLVIRSTYLDMFGDGQQYRDLQKFPSLLQYCKVGDNFVFNDLIRLCSGYNPTHLG